MIAKLEEKPRRFQDFCIKQGMPKFQQEFVKREYAKMEEKRLELIARNERMMKKFRERQVRNLKPATNQ